MTICGILKVKMCATICIGKNHKFSSMADSEGHTQSNRLVMAEYLGRPLTRHELVHHKDYNRDNDDITNLKLMSREEHRWITIRDKLEQSITRNRARLKEDEIELEALNFKLDALGYN